MADTWVANAQDVACASAKDMLDVFNGGSSATVIRVYQIMAANKQTGAVTGIVDSLDIRRITAASSGTTVTPAAYDTSNTALDANTTAGHNRTVTPTDTLRRTRFSSEEFGSGGIASTISVITFFCEMWALAMETAEIEPIVCRAGYGVSIYHGGSSAVGQISPEIVFTSAGS